MRVPLRWLEEWVDVPVSVEALAEQFTMAGLEVDEIERSGPDLSEVRVGHVVTREQHPNADRLSLCQVDIGEGELRPIVCGAPNVAAGQKVAVAVPGTLLPDGTKLKKSKIRGEKSLGMICSARELGLGDEHDGILVLDAAAEIGTSVTDVLDGGESVMEIAILANRGDCTSMLGVAREVRAHFGGEVRIPDCVPSEGARAAADDVSVEIADTAGCYRYAARVVRGVTVGPSPDWLCAKLEAAGLRPINNVVDVTNLVLLEFGQPLHAFDLAKVRGGRVSVRAADAGESLRTLDGEERKLDTGDLVIADEAGAIALAGIMGGADTEVRRDTRDILIESAHFDPRRIRPTARRLGLSTDASYRFERGVDREGTLRAADRAARLIAELTGGEVSRGALDVRGDAPPATASVELDPARLNRLLGTALSPETVVECLARLEIEKLREQDGVLEFAIPSFRTDLSRYQDLVEEVARIHGFDRIPARAQRAELREGQHPALWPIANAAVDSLVAQGLVEVQTFPFMDPGDLDRLALDAEDPRRDTVGILNPIVDSDSRMRPTLLASLLRVTRENLHRQLPEVRLFEVARVFRARGKGELPEERTSLAAVLTQGTDEGLWERNTDVPLFFRVKGIVDRLQHVLGRDLRVESGESEPYLHPGAAARILAGRDTVGSVGELHPAVATAFDIELPCAIVEMDLSAVGELPIRELKYREVSRFPLMRRDLAVLLDSRQPAGEVLEAIRKKAGAHLSQVEIFDRYDGKGVPEGKVSLAFRLTYQRTDRTLTDAEVTKATDRVVQMLVRQFAGELR